MKVQTRPEFPEYAAPSVLLPEIAIPSAGTSGAPLSRIYRPTRSFGLRVSGAVAPSAPALKAGLSRIGRT
ncbi:hypothetical protein GFGA_1d0430 [Gluconobacter frateurii NBRC 103465]|nr:hypothetical protein GFGA_1d0430 [Gluconobacter frateurii NBRC 103465]